MDRDIVHKEIITGYRNFIYERYDFKKIKSSYDVPKSITKDVLDELRDYYLLHVYPEYAQRKALESAFSSLDTYIQKPQKLLVILLDASKIMFKYGRNIPKILTTGLKALQTFKSAQKFENTLVTEAIRLQMKGPYDAAKIKILLQSIPRKEINAFIKTSQSLFTTLQNRPLVRKIKEIIRFIIITMQKNTNHYSKEQIEGLQMGYALINKGDTLLQSLPNKEQKKLIFLITKIETDMLDGI